MPESSRPFFSTWLQALVGAEGQTQGLSRVRQKSYHWVTSEVLASSVLKCSHNTFHLCKRLKEKSTCVPLSTLTVSKLLIFVETSTAPIFLVVPIYYPFWKQLLSCTWSLIIGSTLHFMSYLGNYLWIIISYEIIIILKMCTLNFL